MSRYFSDSTGYYDSESSTTDPRAGGMRYGNHHDQPHNRPSHRHRDEFESDSTTGGRYNNRNHGRAAGLFNYTENFTRNFGFRGDDDSESEDNDGRLHGCDGRHDISHRRLSENALGPSSADSRPRRGALGGPEDPRNPRPQRHGEPRDGFGLRPEAGDDLLSFDQGQGEELDLGSRRGRGRHGSAAVRTDHGPRGAERVPAEWPSDGGYVRERPRGARPQGHAGGREGEHGNREHGRRQERYSCGVN